MLSLPQINFKPMLSVHRSIINIIESYNYKYYYINEQITFKQYLIGFLSTYPVFITVSYKLVIFGINKQGKDE